MSLAARPIIPPPPKTTFFISAMALHGKQYDGHTLKNTLGQITHLTHLTGIKLREVQVAASKMMIWRSL